MTSFITSISSRFYTKLDEIAARGNGKVPLHGRLFAQWLHYVFPLQCPFPHAAGSVQPQTQGERLLTDKSVMIEVEERSEHMVPNMSLSEGGMAVSESANEELWS